MVTRPMVSGATLSPGWEGPPWGKNARHENASVVLESGMLLKPLPSPLFPLLLPAAETQQQQRPASWVTAPPGYRLHLQVETKLSKRRHQLRQRILPGSLSGPSANPHPVACQHPSSSHSSLASVYFDRDIALRMSSAFKEGRRIPKLLYWATLSNPTPLTARTSRKQQLLCVYVRPSRYL